MAKPKPEQDEKGRFVPGNSGNGGRPKGSRNRLGEAFVAGLYADSDGAQTKLSAIGRVSPPRALSQSKTIRNTPSALLEGSLSNSVC
jgi:hypothetical protein